MRVGWMKTARVGLVLLLFLSCVDSRTASTVEPLRTVDASFRPGLVTPSYPEGEGPVVCVDEAHNNFHTSEGTFKPFADVLRSDGYVVRRALQRIGDRPLSECEILVIADAQPPAKAGESPTFSAAEVSVLNQWVREGGALLLITDHMPDPGAIRDLAASFGIEVNDGYILNGAPRGPERPLVFSRDDGTLAPDSLTGAMGDESPLQQIATFTGSAFRPVESTTPEAVAGSMGAPFRPILVFRQGTESWMPEEYWVFDESTRRRDVSGWYQGGVLEWGAGRLALFSEAAMFTAQVFDDGRVRAGMNAEEAVDNLRLLRRVMRWLSRNPGSEPMLPGELP